MAKDVEIVLKKEGSKDITVKCPRTVKLSPVIAALYILWGCPPLWVKPIDWKGAFISFLAYPLIVISLAVLFLVSPGFGLVLLAAVLVLEFLFNRDYFFNFFKKRLAEGYTVEDEEQKQILKEAGVFVESNNTSTSSTNSSVQKTEDVASQIEKLGALVEKGLLSKEEFDAQKAKLLGL